MTAAHPKRPILVVDDEPEMLYSLKGLLRRDFDVHTAGSGAEGIEILRDHPIHLVMTDQRMPEMTGVEFLSHIKTEHPAAIRLIFTGYADIKAVIDAINQGNVFRYVTKPWDPEELVKALHEAGSQYDQIVARKALLADLRSYEAQCIAFGNGLNAGRYGAVTPEGMTQASELVNVGRNLIARIDRALEPQSANAFNPNGEGRDTG